MNELSLLKLLLVAVSMLCVLRLFVFMLLGDAQSGPGIGRLLRRQNVPPETDAKRRKGVCESRRSRH